MTTAFAAGVGAGQGGGGRAGGWAGWDALLAAVRPVPGVAAAIAAVFRAVTWPSVRIERTGAVRGEPVAGDPRPGPLRCGAMSMWPAPSRWVTVTGAPASSGGTE